MRRRKKYHFYKTFGSERLSDNNDQKLKEGYISFRGKESKKEKLFQKLLPSYPDLLPQT